MKNKNGKVDRTKGIDEVINDIDIDPSDQVMRKSEGSYYNLVMHWYE
ncbi:MAG: hypothetical protein ACJ71K_17280 [Nitrososphaeraceae archaeon]